MKITKEKTVKRLKPQKLAESKEKSQNKEPKKRVIKLTENDIEKIVKRIMAKQRG